MTQERTIGEVLDVLGGRPDPTASRRAGPARGDLGGVVARLRCSPIAKGRLGKPVEFGYKAQLVDNEDGVIVDHHIEQGNPPDAPMLMPAIERIIQRTGGHGGR